MGTIKKPYNTDEMRIKASERNSCKMFKGAPFIYIKYKDTLPKVIVQYKDGVKAFLPYGT